MEIVGYEVDEARIPLTMGATDGISWTLDREKAEWFATRFTEDGVVYSAKVKSNDILYYISDRGEKEVIVDPKRLMQVERI